MKNLTVLILLLLFASFPVLASRSDSSFLEYSSVKGRVTSGAITKLSYKRTSSFLIDGGIRDLSSGKTDQTATGLLGYRISGFNTRLDLSFLSVSTLNSIKSDDIKEYSRTILNPYNTQNGVSFNFSILGRHWNLKREVLSRLWMLYQKDSISLEVYKNSRTSDLEALEQNVWWRSLKLGYLVEFQASNISWTNSSDEVQLGNMIAFNPYFIRDIRMYDDVTEDFVELILGLGPSYRGMAGDMTKDFRESVLGTRDKSFLGAQATVQLYYKNFYAKAYYAIYKGDDYSIVGLTDGQFYLSVGITAEIGSNKLRTKQITELFEANVDRPAVK